MKVEALACPSCGAALSIPGDREFFVCEACKSSLAVTRPPAGPTLLTRFETILARVGDATDFLAADRRLQYLEGEIAAAVARQAHLEREVHLTRARLANLERESTRKNEDRQTYAVLGALACAAGLLLFAWALPGWSALLWLAAAAGGAAVAWRQFARIKAVRNQIAAQREASRTQTGALDEELRCLRGDLEDYRLERSLCRAQIKKYHYKGQG